jgi:hypothetical protein
MGKKINQSESLEESVELQQKQEEKEKVFDFQGREYSFTKDAGDGFRFNDVYKTLEEWVEDEIALELLIKGNSSLIKQINK